MKIVMKRLSIGVSILLFAGCSLTESAPQTPPPIVKTTEQHVCVDAQAQVIDCPEALSLQGEAIVNAKVQGNNAAANEQQKIRQQLAQPRNNEAQNVAQEYDETQTSDQTASHHYQQVVIPQHTLSDAQHSVLVSEYIEQIASQLIENVATDVDHAVVGVTSFVDFNNDLSTITSFGNRIAEHFYLTLFQQGFTVADYKVRSKVSITRSGDYVFSRNVNKLDNAKTMTHVLTGTVMYQQTGLLINARIVDFDSKWVVSTASGFIPYFVLDSIVPAAGKSTVL